MKLDFIYAAAMSTSDACIHWPWAKAGAPVYADGYGRFVISGRRFLAHRISLEMRLGRELSNVEQSQHRCDNPICINGNHLKPGDNSSNIKDALSRGRRTPVVARSGVDQHLAKLNPEKVREIRRRHAAGESARSLAKEFGVYSNAIDLVCSLKTWKHVK